MELSQFLNISLGEHEIRYEARDAILYALLVGARSDQLDLVYERDLRVLPTYACALGLWAVERAGDLGAYDRKRSLHAAQSLVMHCEMPREGRILTSGRVAAVWDKGRAAVVDIEVSSTIFTATYSIYLPDMGGWGGDAEPKVAAEFEPQGAPTWRSSYSTAENLAALYRLTGDLHPIHIDAEVSSQNGFDRPILHGLCTLGIAARELAAVNGSHPADLRTLRARLSAPVMPGDEINFQATAAPNQILFDARVGDRSVLKAGGATFS